MRSRMTLANIFATAGGTQISLKLPHSGTVRWNFNNLLLSLRQHLRKCGKANNAEIVCTKKFCKERVKAAAFIHLSALMKKIISLLSIGEFRILLRWFAKWSAKGATSADIIRARIMVKCSFHTLSSSSSWTVIRDQELSDEIRQGLLRLPFLP